MITAGEVQGYCAIWNESSMNMAARNEPAWYETIVPGALAVADNAFLNSHHNEFTASAFRHDGSLLVGSDDVGMWFEARLGETMPAYDIINGLHEYGALPVSFVMSDVTERWEGTGDGRVRFVERAVVNVVSICDRTRRAIPERGHGSRRDAQ